MNKMETTVTSFLISDLVLILPFLSPVQMEEIEKLKTQLEELRIQDRQTAAVVAKSRRYQDFLELACERSEDHKSADIEDFLTRHETLKAAHADLIST